VCLHTARDQALHLGQFTSLDIFNELARFNSIRKPKAGEEHYLIAGDSEVKIEGHGRVDVPVTKPDGSIGILRIKDAAYCPTFAVNVESFQCLYDRGIRWDTISTPTREDILNIEWL
jgi:hypothetical protein